jgi:excisionase family DNA binding protein
MLDVDKNLETIEGGLFTVPEASGFSRLSRSDLYSRMERGELAYCKVGRRRLIPKRALLEMLGRGFVSRQPAMADSAV